LAPNARRDDTSLSGRKRRLRDINTNFGKTLPGHDPTSHAAARKRIASQRERRAAAESQSVLIRARDEALFLDERAAADGQPRLGGHFCVFNEWTEIREFGGYFLERFIPGAFKKTIADRRDKVRCLFQHGQDPQVGDKPLGPIEELKEDDKGVFYSVPLLDTSYNADLIKGLRAGIYGASFRFRVIRESRDENPPKSTHNPNGLPERTIEEAGLMEFGPVTFPAYEGATAGLRMFSLTDHFLRSQDMEPRVVERMVAIEAGDLPKPGWWM
jgi:HK97 family phage prohead protease